MSSFYGFSSLFLGIPKVNVATWSYPTGWETVPLCVIWKRGTQGQQLWPSITREPTRLSCLQADAYFHQMGARCQTAAAAQERAFSWQGCEHLDGVMKPAGMLDSPECRQGLWGKKISSLSTKLQLIQLKALWSGLRVEAGCCSGGLDSFIWTL